MKISIIINSILTIINIIILFKTFSFSIYEIKEKKNKSGATICIITELVAFSLIMYILWIR